jgi:cob(I)alamin adenosyltransferase
MKIYTKTGDAGETGLFGGPRVGKHHPRIAAYGEIDELNSVLGFARTQGLPAEIDAVVARIQGELFSVGAELATPDPKAHGMALIGQTHVARLENDIDRFEEKLKPLKHFILPGGSVGAASLHMARSVCRRAEREIALLANEDSEQLSAHILRYINRLSDLLFVLARTANHQANIEETAWKKDSGTS